MDIKQVNVNDINIAYREIGVGDPLLLIMGYRGTMEMWDPMVLKILSSHYRVIIFDNRGMGKTTSSEKEYSIELFAEDTNGFLCALGIKRSNILGYSLGSSIALEFILKYPDKVNNLILYGGDCGGEESIKPEPKYINSLLDMSGNLDDILNRVTKLLFDEKWINETPNPQSYLPLVTDKPIIKNLENQFNALLSWKGAYHRLNQINSPTLIITGKDDLIRPAANSVMLAEKIKNSCLVQLFGGHGLMHQYPVSFCSFILAFLSQDKFPNSLI